MADIVNILVCHCGAGIFPDRKREQLMDALKRYQVNIVELQDLCALAVHDKGKIEPIINKKTKNIFVACYPRAIENMLMQNGVKCSSFEVLNFRLLSVENVLDKLVNTYGVTTGNAEHEVLESDLNVPAWYPVIDQSRCNLCGKCAKFCLFGVYKFNGKKLQVIEPLNCKNNCPACGRTCPSSAIIFPRLPENSVLSGDLPGIKRVVETGENNQQLFSALNERNKNRKQIFRGGLLQQAEKERAKALKELKKGGK